MCDLVGGGVLYYVVDGQFFVVKQCLGVGDGVNDWQQFYGMLQFIQVEN